MLELVPFETGHGEYIAKWYFDTAYQYYFAHIGSIPTMNEFAQYPQWAGHSVMMVKHGKLIIGMVTMQRAVWRNGTCEVGVLIDVKQQGDGLGRSATVLWMDHLFGLGFRKLMFRTVDMKIKSLLMQQGCSVEAVHERHCWLNGAYIDEYVLAYWRDRP